MKITYYGTGAGAGIPEIFCDCRVCHAAREKGGVEIRSRSQASIDDKICIELPVDTFMHHAKGGLDMRKLHHILITHAHYDHLLRQELFSRPENTGEPYHIYLSAGSEAFIDLLAGLEHQEEVFRTGKRRRPDFKLIPHIVRAFEPFMIEDYRIIPLPAHHAKNVESLIYIIEHGDEAILWCHDTGPLLKETWAYLETYPGKFGYVSLDCTLKRGDRITASHMDIDQCAEVADRLRELGRLTDDCLLYLSHIGHLLDRTHDEMAAEAAELGMCVAHDGLTVNC